MRHVKETTQQPEAPQTTGNKSAALRRCLIPRLGSVPRLAPCRFFVSSIFFFLSVVAVVVALSVSVTDVVELTLWETAADENGCSDGHQRGIVKTLKDLFLFFFYLTRCFSCHCCTLT